MEAIDVIKNLSSVFSIIIASQCYCYFISSNIPKGIFRLISFFPVFCIFTIIPFYLCSTYATLAISGSITCLCNFKLLLLVFDKGPLSCQKSKLSLVTFITIAALAIKIEETKGESKKKKVTSNLAINAVLFALVTEFLIHYRGRLSLVLLSVLYCLFIFLLLEILFWCCFWIAKSLTGLELGEPSNKPYLATSVQDFWGRRWNINISDILRHTIYIPVRAASEKVIGKGLCSTCLGGMAAFVVSGLMHELLFYHMMKDSVSWKVTLFFVIQGVVVSIEIVLKKKFKDKLRLPWFVSGPLTIGFVVITARRLFFAEFLRIGIDVRLLEEFNVFVEYFKVKILNLSPLSGATLS